MKKTYQERLTTCLKRILSQLPKEAGAREHAFAKQFFIKMPLADLERMTPQTAARIAMSAYVFAETRPLGKAKIRIFQPTRAEHGYESRRTVIELLNDDMPFLVDSFSNELLRLGYGIHETIHPVLRVSRDRKGALQDVVEKENAEAASESLIHFEVSSHTGGVEESVLRGRLETVLAFIRAAVADWPAMTACMQAEEDALQGNEQEERAFLAWLRAKNFVFLGVVDGKKRLGICAVDNALGVKQRGKELLSITKSDRAAPVHRPVLMDVVVVQRGTSVVQFFGLFTSAVYYQSVEAIPLVRRKLERVMERSGLAPVSHDGKILKAILEFLPRDEMFQTTDDELLDVSMGLLALESKPGVRLFVRKDVEERFVSCMAFVPREYFSTQLRVTLVDMLAGAFHGKVENFYTQMTESALARLHVIIRTTPGQIPEVDAEGLEREISRFTHAWPDSLREALEARLGEVAAEPLFAQFVYAFPASYISRYDMSATVYDIEKCHEALTKNGLAVDFYQLNAEPAFIHLKIYSPAEEIALSDILPMLENMGFRAIDEHPFLVRPRLAEPRDVWIRDFKLTLAEGRAMPLAEVKRLLEEALLAVWGREMESDSFNALVLRAGLSFRQVVMLRAYAKYLRQIGFAYSQSAIETAMNANPIIAQHLVALFDARFNPDADAHEVRVQTINSSLEALLAEVSNLTEDRILRQYIQLMRATLRTNYFQHARPVLSFKLRSAEVPNLPKPVPFAEIFVYGMRVEGIHLRGGKVARGGLRWSDRREDFRTEVLGLMKAQMVKNSVIVPVGSKGGFVLKQLPSASLMHYREALQAEGIACYRLYLHGLLDVTDNIVNGAVVPPPRVVRYDNDDPYLVVAADKGTATFSDIANEISQSYGFWLDDAFASGGSAGYDHKEMGITARGGWVSVVRHFREMGVDIAKQEFTAAGIGDLAGDVFGNGMLLSDKMKLLAAFNHQHIFIDPTPDAKVSFEERTRMFHLPRSTWKDYDAKKISKGGGVFERSAKTITLSREARAALGVERESFTPDELIRVILMAPVDLLWNGGIGTYVKAEEESHDQVGDRANNAVRINGRELRAKVVGEGGNLGFTQKGRIEYARTGGRINTDAIDNSGGVDCSDHEVNIKIAFSGAMQAARLTREKRNIVLTKMTDEVAALVLKDNFLQTQAISLAEAQGAALLESQSRLMRALEAQGLLDRAIEYLPTDRQIAELKSAGKGLTRPELAVLLAYSKMALYRDILESSLPDEPYFSMDLMRYFPKAMQKDFEGDIVSHPLKREIIATVMTNSLVNRAGLTFFSDMTEDTALPTREIAAAYALARDAFDLRDLWLEIERTSASVSPVVQAEMLTSINRLIERVALWALRNLAHPMDVDKTIQLLKGGVQEFRRSLSSMHSPATRAQYEAVSERLKAAGAGEALVASVASLEMLASACDVIRVAKATELSIAEVGLAYFALGDSLSLEWLRAQGSAIKAATHWDRLALRGLVQDLFDEQRRLTSAVLHAGSKASGKSLEEWMQAQQGAIARYSRFTDDLRQRENLELSALLVALKHVRMLG